ncbi:DUF1080 domain-containing protein [Fulvivirga sp. M361]|uniref:3-keto-disaccharide hydrolase n=1 Tax=Fulvivirga sp. M361 TaxID=2594266 RepID=UPI001179E70B|nr:DUF1080 domain-containing protein [Fulvivirga sp. M361]TRX56301.1 DUF1080 domain-containing protein [Fulvivirga sp. M361]
MKIPKALIICVLIVIGPFGYGQSSEGWEILFNGKNLKGWEKLNGTADYIIVDSAIVGTSKLNTPNTFLATKKVYKDFILEFEVKVENELNSGVQFRSLSNKSYKNGRVHGYQAEIDPSRRAYSGGIYDEARRKWLYPLGINPKGQKAFRPGQWNTYRVEAIGPHIRTWVNGVMCANLVDHLTAEGFIALQVHSINSHSQVGKKVMWRNIRIKTTDLNAERREPDPAVKEVSYLINQLTEGEKRRGYRLLWDGNSSKGWRGAKLDHFPESGWEMKDGVLTVLTTDGGESTGPGDIVTIDKFGDFELELEFMITKGANSGIKYYVDPALNKGAGSAIGCEYQILDNENHPDAKKGVLGNRTMASLYDLITAENLSNKEDQKRTPFKGVGTWNHARIMARNGKVEHWLNHEKVVEYDRFSQMFSALVNYSKYQKWPNFGRWPAGSILLQDHGNTVHFRSVKVREF